MKGGSVQNWDKAAGCPINRSNSISHAFLAKISSPVDID